MFVPTVSISAKAHNLSQVFYRHKNIGADLLSFWLPVKTFGEEVMEGFSLVPVAREFSEFLARDALRIVALLPRYSFDRQMGEHHGNSATIHLSVCPSATGM